MGASIDIEWSALDADLTRSVSNAISEAFQAAKRPNFIGELSITSFSFGDVVPQVELTDVCDIYKEFYEVDDDDDIEQAVAQAAPSLVEPHQTYSARSLRASTPLHDTAGDPFDQSASIKQQLSAQSGPDAPDPAPASFAPAVQLHLSVAYEGNLTIGVSTSLLINHPTPRFMSLPLKLNIASLAFKGTFVVAYEGPRRRIHVSILDPKQEMLMNNHAANHWHQSNGADPNSSTASSSMLMPSTPGARLLQDAVVETEVGQTDKHVLRNVGKVEKFVIDLIRSTLESELVFPNFQTIIY